MRSRVISRARLASVAPGEDLRGSITTLGISAAISRSYATSLVEAYCGCLSRALLGGVGRQSDGAPRVGVSACERSENVYQSPLRVVVDFPKILISYRCCKHSWRR